MVATTYANSPGGSIIQGRKARGTLGTPLPVQANDIIASFSAEGYGTTGFGIGPRAGMVANAAETWTDAAQGTTLSFLTAPLGSNASQNRLFIDPDGNVGLGTQAPSEAFELSRTGDNAAIVSTVYTSGDAGAFLAVQTARGTAAAPTAAQAGDFLGGLLFNGYGATRFRESAGVVALAAENFSDTASGAALAFGTTSLGAHDADVRMALLPSGNLGIGTPPDVNGIPTAADKLQVFGDIRVGTTGTDGCVKNFAGTGIAGTCSSDWRLKKDITPFNPVLGRLTALQPVHYYWRAEDFPERHFGNDRAYGLVAQEVEQVLPELVVTGRDGYKAVDYSALPLLTVQAVKELKSENDLLKERVAELERLVNDLLARSPRR